MTAGVSRSQSHTRVCFLVSACRLFHSISPAFNLFCFLSIGKNLRQENHSERTFCLTSNGVLTANAKWVAKYATEAFSTICVVHIEDCEGWCWNNKPTSLLALEVMDWSCWVQERSEAIDIRRYLMQSTASMSDPFRNSGLCSVFLDYLREINTVHIS